MNSNNAGLSVTKPIALWNKPLTADAKSLFKSLAKAVGHAHGGNWFDFASDLVDFAGAVGVRTKPEERAWLLIRRSLQLAMLNLIAEASIAKIETLPPMIEETAQKLDREFHYRTDFYGASLMCVKK